MRTEAQKQYDAQYRKKHRDDVAAYQAWYYETVTKRKPRKLWPNGFKKTKQQNHGFGQPGS